VKAIDRRTYSCPAFQKKQAGAQFGVKQASPVEGNGYKWLFKAIWWVLLDLNRPTFLYFAQKRGDPKRG